MKGLYIILPVIFCCACMELNGQNFGYFGRKHAIHAGVQFGRGPNLVNGKPENRWVIGIERSMHQKWSVFAEVQGQNSRTTDAGINDQIFLESPFDNKRWNGTITHYSMHLNSRAAIFGIKYFFSSKGAISPLGSYALISNDITETRYLEGGIRGQFDDMNTFPIYKYFEFTDIKPFTIRTQFTNVGIGHSRIFFNRFITDFSIGMSTSFFNSGPYMFKRIKEMKEVRINNPEDWLKYNISYNTYYSRILWLKYKVGFIF